MLTGLAVLGWPEVVITYNHQILVIAEHARSLSAHDCCSIEAVLR